MLAARRHAALLVGSLACVVGLLGTRMLLGARSELHAAEQAARRGDGAARVRHLRRSMAYYLPGNPFVRRAGQALLEEARQAEAAGQPERALAILHELRSAILSLRGLTRPLAGDLPEINRRIAELSAARPDAARALRSPVGAQALLRRLERPPEPHPLWAGLGLLGFLIYGGAGLLLCFAGLQPDAARLRYRFWPLLGAVLLGLLLFGLGMGLA